MSMKQASLHRTSILVGVYSQHTCHLMFMSIQNTCKMLLRSSMCLLLSCGRSYRGYQMTPVTSIVCNSERSADAIGEVIHRSKGLPGAPRLRLGESEGELDLILCCFLPQSCGGCSELSQHLISWCGKRHLPSSGVLRKLGGGP